MQPRAVLPGPSPATLLHDPRHTRKLTTGCAVLDETLGGGIDARGLVEIAGTAGSGKTQLALQLMLQAMLPPSMRGLGGGAVFMHTDSPSYTAPLQRLGQLADAFAERHRDMGANRPELMQQVHCMVISSDEMLSEVLHQQLPKLLQEKQVGCSCAPPRRRESSSHGMLAGAADRARLGRWPLPRATRRADHAARKHLGGACRAHAGHRRAAQEGALAVPALGAVAAPPRIARRSSPRRSTWR